MFGTALGAPRALFPFSEETCISVPRSVTT